MFELLFIPPLLIGALGIYIWYKQKYSTTIPCSDLSPVYGHLHKVSLNDNSYLAFNESEMLKHKHVYNFWLGPLDPTAYVCSTSGVKAVLQNSEEKGYEYKALIPWFGQKSIILSTGSYWKNKRNKYAEMFRADVLKDYVKIYAQNAETLMNKWFEDAEANREIDLLCDIKKLTLCVGNECIFDNKLEMFSKETEEYHHRMESMAKVIFDRNINPFFKYEFIHKLSNNYKETSKLIKELDEISNQLLIKKKEKYDRDASFKSIIDLLLDVQHDMIENNEEPMSDKEIIGEINSLLFAAHDTSSHAILWTFYCISKYPEVENKIIKEINEVLGDRDVIETDDLSKLKYLKKVVNESLRLYPPAAMFTRKLNSDIDVNGHIVKGGNDVVVFVYLIHRNPLHWKDPNTFNPDRFDETPELYSFLPFSTGSRNCIGKFFALNEIYTVLGMFYKRMRMKIDKSYMPRPSIILKPHETMMGRIEVQ